MVVEAESVAVFPDVVPVAFLTAVAGFDAGADVVVVSFLTAVGRGFLVPAAAGFELSLTPVFDVVTGVFLAGFVVFEGLEAADTAFLVVDDVAAGVAFAGAAVFAVVVEDEVEAPAALSFLGAFFTGVAVVPEVVVAAGFFTGVALAVDDVVFAGVALVGFFAVD